MNKKAYNASQVDIIPGAAGGPKGIGIQGLDQAIFADFLPRAATKAYFNWFIYWQLAFCQYCGLGRH